MAARCEEQYLAISRSTGNRLAEAYAPFMLDSIAVEQGQFEEAEAFLQQGMQAAQENGWPRLIDVGRQSLASLQFYRWCEQRDPTLLHEAIAGLKELAQIPHVDQNGEFFTTLALAIYLSGDAREARAVLRRTRALADESWVTDSVWLDYAEAVIHQRSWKKPMEWFRQHGFLRAVGYIERVEHAMDRQREVK
jgi:tetratricopeptide (TPR) repeat protein